MSTASETAVVAPLYRINKYTVPVEARQQFVELVDKTLGIRTDFASYRAFAGLAA